VDIRVESRVHGALRARDVLAEIERDRVEAIATALAETEACAAERLEMLDQIRISADILTRERNDLRDKLEDCEETNAATVRDLDAARAERDAALADATELRALLKRKAKGA
jgi:asparagine synthetase A